MKAGLHHVPFDVVHQLACMLDLDSYIHLSRVNKLYYGLLHNSTTVKRCIQTNVSYASEHHQNRDVNSTVSRRFNDLQRTYQCRNAIRQASPYSVSTVAYAESFAFDQGALSYVEGSKIRILQLNSQHDSEKILSGRLFSKCLPKELTGSRPPLGPPKSMVIQACVQNILVVLCQFNEIAGHFLFAVNIADDFPCSGKISGPERRVQLCVRLHCVEKLFIRHNNRFLYFGFYSFSHQNTWIVQGYNLNTGSVVSRHPLRLSGLMGTEVASNIAFTLHENEFVAITTQTDLEGEEINWASYYHFIRFALDDPDPKLEVCEIYRRDLKEGPVNDSWNDLSFQVDEQTNELLVVEGRREWLGGASTSVRTYYTLALDRVPWKIYDRNEITLNPNSQLSHARESHDQTRWEAHKPVRIPKYTHLEFSSSFSGNKREYVRSKTKWNSYCFNANAFLDLVVDEIVLPGEWRSTQRLRLRVVSRVEIDSSGTSRTPHAQDLRRVPSATPAHCRTQLASHQVRDSHCQYSDSKLFMWPRDDKNGTPNKTLTSIDNIMCPQNEPGELKAVLGDKWLVYMAGPRDPNHDGGRALILISFDPRWGFRGMVRENGDRVFERRSRNVSPAREQSPSPISPSHGLSSKRKSWLIEDTGSTANNVSPMPKHHDEKKIKTDHARNCSSGLLQTSPLCSSIATAISQTWDWSAISHLQFSNISPLQPPRKNIKNIKIGNTSQPTSSNKTDSTIKKTSERLQELALNSPPRLMWREKSRYISINRGIWLR